jgi:transcriptional regulator with GAF, ATPase, and Fis domain
VRVGLACFPDDGRDAEALMGQACARLEARPDKARRGGNGGGDSELDPSMAHLHKLVDRIAPSTIPVLLLGETGVGKNVLAQAIHTRSTRAKKPFLTLNCSTLSETLLESELFGHEKGAFTGAVQAKSGLFESAQGGTVFLDEIGELPLSVQVKLLNVLESHQFMRVGGTRAMQLDVRFLAATNRDLEAEIALGRFRQDLYFRINGISLVIPPLRERGGELVRLAALFVERASERLGRDHAPKLSSAALAAMRSYSWPGNIRELRNMMERAVLLAVDEVIDVDHLPVDKMQMQVAALPRLQIGPAPGPLAPSPSDGGEAVHQARESLKSAERQRVLDALEQCGGNQTKAAKMLGISRSTLVTRLIEYGLPRPRKR